MTRHRRWVWLAALGVMAAGLWLRLPAADGGFRTDDYVQLSALRDRFPVHRDPLDLFRFDGQDAVSRAQLRHHGYHPWWALPELKLSMWRPLSSGLIWLDHGLFGLDAYAYHLHSLGWWLCVVVAATWCFAILRLPPLALVLAIGMFAFDESHNVPVAWLANRNTLVATAFGLLTLGVQLRIADPSVPAPLLRGWWQLSPVPALLAGEYALPVLALCIAHAALGPVEGGARKRLLLAAPVCGWTLVYLSARALTGHGIAGSGYYISPLTDPLAYGGALVDRLPLLLGHAVAGVPIGVRGWGALRPLPGLLVLLGLIALAVHAVRQHGTGGETVPRHRGWLAAGIVLSCLPGVGSLPEARVLQAAGFGTAALLCLELAHFGRNAAHGAALLAFPTALVVAFHVLNPAAIAREHAVGFAARARELTRTCLQAPIPAGDDVGVYIVAAADFTTAANLPFARDLHGLGQPRFYRRLSGALRPHALTRTGRDRFELTVLSDPGSSAFAGSLYRASDRPLQTGDRIDLAGMRVDVLGARRGQAWKLGFTLDRDLDDPSLVWLRQTRAGTVRMKMPAIGERIVIPRPQAAR